MVEMYATLVINGIRTIDSITNETMRKAVIIRLRERGYDENGKPLEETA